MKMEWLNEKPLEHTSSNGTTFKADRCDLRGGVIIEYPSYLLTDQQKMDDFLQFGAWHRGEIWQRLNGFSGYDCVQIKTPSNAGGNAT